jgi:hypothetical protein
VYTSLLGLVFESHLSHSRLGRFIVQSLLEYLHLWDALAEVNLAPEIQDVHLWTPSASGCFSSKSAYERFSIGSVGFELANRVWKSWAPVRCKYFIWLASGCLTADRLARRLD